MTSWAGPLGARGLQAPGALASADLKDSRATQKVLCNNSSAFFSVLLGRGPVVMGRGRPRITLPFIFELDKALFPREMVHHLCPPPGCSPNLRSKNPSSDARRTSGSGARCLSVARHSFL